MNPEDILKMARESIKKISENDPDKWFYANRYVFARLQLDERKTKTDIKRRLIDSNSPCHYCGKSFESKKDICLHRLEGSRGYNQENCALMHRNCHTRYHQDNPGGDGRGRPPLKVCIHDSTVLVKKSQKYENKPFLYWWDITPNLRDSLIKYDNVEFVQKDTGKSCSVPVPALMGFLTDKRQTSRGDGNWGIKVLKDQTDTIAFEPGTNNDRYLFLSVVWTDHKR